MSHNKITLKYLIFIIWLATGIASAVYMMYFMLFVVNTGIGMAFYERNPVVYNIEIFLLAFYLGYSVFVLKNIKLK